MSPRSSTVTALCIALLSFPIRAASSSDPSTTATAALSALLASRAATLRADVTAFQAVRKRFECVQSTGSRAEVVALTDRSATVLVDVAATATLPVTHAACDFPFNWLVQLRKSGREWQVERVWTPESDVAARIDSASDPFARLSLLNESPRYVTPELARCLVERGRVLESKSRSREAADLAEIALTIAQETGSEREEARALFLLAKSFDSRQQFNAPLAIYNGAHAMAEKTGDATLIATALVGIVTERDRHGDLGATPEAAEAYRLALLLGDERLAAHAIYHLGVHDEYAGRYGDALHKYTEAARRAERGGDRLLQAAATAQTGVAYDYMGNQALSFEFLRRGIELYRKAGNVRGVILNLRNLGDLEAAGHHFADAEKHLRETEALLAKYPNIRTSAFITATRENIAVQRHDLATAERLCLTGIDLANRAGIDYLVTILTYQLAEVRLQQKRYDEAISLAAEAVRRATSVTPLYDSYLHAQMIRGKALVALGRPEEARRSYEGAIAAIERSRPNIPAPDDDQQLFLSDKDWPYYEMFRTLIDDDPAEAVLWVERARARTLLEFLTHGHRQSTRSLSEAERSDEARIEKAMAELNVSIRDERARPELDAAQIERLEKKLAELRNRRSVLMRELYERHPDLAFARGDIPLPSVDEMRAAVPPDGIVAEYVTLDDGAWLIAITRDAAPRVYTIAANESKLRALSEGLAKAIASRDARVYARSRALYELLLHPAEEVLRGKKTIGIVADSTLRNVPFQMLAGRNGEFLIQKHAVFYAPSLAFLVWRSKHRQDHGAERQLLALANPAISTATATEARARIRGEALGALPEAEREVRALSSIYGRSQATLRIGAAATEKEFKRTAGRYRILHLATHGMYDDTDPMYSHLVLARSPGDDNDGLLEAREIVDLDLHADLAVLSACATGRAVARGGEGMIGLSWAFLGAGCPAAVVSLWSVESAATERLMVNFHRHLVRGDSAPEALRLAEVSLMTSRRYHHPYYWAPFVVVGAPWP